MTKKVKETEEVKETLPVSENDDALFEALGKSKKRKKRKIIIIVAAIVVVLAVVTIVGVIILRQKVQEEFASSSGEVLSYEVTTGTISTVVFGSGTLTDVDPITVTVPAGVEVTDVLIKTNASINEGDVIATVNMSTVMSAMADLQTEIEELDEEISDAEDDEADDVIYAGVSGRVKAIFAEAGKSVADIMYENGALALISLDGYMAVDVPAGTLAVGDSVTVTLSDGESVSGTVSSISSETATILVSDNGPEYNEAVTVLASDGTSLGEGTLYIHSALKVTGYAGTVESVSTSVNSKVSDSTKICTLEDTGYSANYNSLLRTRSEKEETLLSLLAIKRNGALLSPITGSVYSVDYDEDSASGAVSEETDIATLSTDEKMSVTISVDESDILSLELGQEVTVTVSSVGEDEFAGTLTEINKTSSSSGTYSAVVELSKEEGMLSGMTASVSVKIEGVENAILIPIEALHETSEGAYVYTQYDEELGEYGEKVDVVTGLENSTYVEIKSGLSEGDTVYYTEEESSFSGFGGMPGGDMSDFGGGEMPSFGGGEMPSGGGGMQGGGDMPARPNN